ncbi:MAG: hypothetical protein AB3N22_17660 [Ruegeria sp.]
MSQIPDGFGVCPFRARGTAAPVQVTCKIAFLPSPCKWEKAWSAPAAISAVVAVPSYTNSGFPNYARKSG